MTSVPEGLTCRYFVTYSGARLPVRLVNPIDENELTHRNTFIRAYFDPMERLSRWEKLVYGRVELAHRYSYDENGTLRRVVIMSEDEEQVLEFDAAGRRGLGPS
ncbi:MAG TPA: DUF6156 family protein [Polyangiaceae bacterium]|nr:DUF6156 family protein [Polyangiaceae bacterium]